jgi:hypothetical protein
VDRSHEATLRDGEARTAVPPAYAEPAPPTVRAAPSPLVPPAPILPYQAGPGSTSPGPRRRWSPVEIATLTIAGVGLALLLALLYMHLSDRGGKASTHPTSALPSAAPLDAGRDAP